MFYRALEDVRMPLFTVLSGYVYAIRPVSDRRHLTRLVMGKVRRLLVPLVVVGTALFTVKLAIPEVNSRPEGADFWRVFFFPYEHLWFLQAVFLIFLTVGLLDAWGALASRRGWATAAGCATLAHLVVHVPAGADVFSAESALWLLPFFLLGHGLNRHAALFDRRLIAGMALAFAPLYALRLHDVVADADEGWHDWQRKALSLSIGFLGVSLLFAARRMLAWPPLIWLGGFSFGIYLLHVFGSAAVRTFLGEVPEPMAFAASLSAGLALPVCFELALGRYRLVSWGVLGQRPRVPAAATGAGLESVSLPVPYPEPARPSVSRDLSAQA